ncbi:MAG: acetyltransferase [Thermoleophilia bacterium]|nr:acetyltransferase [Thermoleophilia bacterium]
MPARTRAIASREMSVPSPRVRCGPIELRLITPRTANQLFTLARDPDVSRQLQWDPHASIDDSLEYIHHAAELWQRGTAWLPGIFDVERGQLVGCTALINIDRANARAEVGSWLGVPHQGRGYNLPAKSALATFAFGELELNRLEFLTRVDNPRSLAAMRKLPNVREEGILAERIVQKGARYDAVMFALLKGEFDGEAWPGATVDPSVAAVGG